MLNKAERSERKQQQRWTQGFLLNVFIVFVVFEQSQETIQMQRLTVTGRNVNYRLCSQSRLSESRSEAPGRPLHRRQVAQVITVRGSYDIIFYSIML